jgi:hypothetical protein
MDLQFVQFSDALQLTGAREIPDLEPRTLQINGPDFRSALEVVINDEGSPSFVIASKNTIMAQVPDGQVKSVIRSIVVLSSDFTATLQSHIRFRIGDNPKYATGLKSMMQTFLKVLLTNQGTDAFAKKIGGSALKNIGRNFDVGNSSSLVSDFAISVRRTEQQIRALQSFQPRMADDERLLSATLLNAKFDVNILTLIARVELISQSGIRAIASLEL